MNDIKTESLWLMKGDCLERMKEIESGSVDMILTDPPYGTTACKWDSIIPLEPMWEQLKRIIKPNGAIVMTASQPFTSLLVCSNLKMFKYTMHWKKAPIGFLNSKKRPLINIEDLVIFSGKTYNPQGLLDCSKKIKRGKQSVSVGHDGGRLRGDPYTQKYTNYPAQLIEFKGERGLHPTQKPVALMEYLIKTYTNEGETVLDFTMGSGTTGVACVNTNRKFIGIEMDDNYFDIGSKRITGGVV
jgi:site-specific DNA-methyltransferase (adenine-specific)